MTYNLSYDDCKQSQYVIVSVKIVQTGRISIICHWSYDSNRAIRCDWGFRRLFPTTQNQIQSYLWRNQVFTSMRLGFDMIIVLCCDLDDQSCALSTIYPRLQRSRSYTSFKQVASLEWLRFKIQLYDIWFTSWNQTTFFIKWLRQLTMINSWI
jgi:hypothetical protein